MSAKSATKSAENPWISNDGHTYRTVEVDRIAEYHRGQVVFVYQHWSSKRRYVVDRHLWLVGKLLLRYEPYPFKRVPPASEYDDEHEHELDELHGF